MFFSLLLNIGLLVLIATLLTKVSVVRGTLSGDNNPVGSRVALIVIFGLVSIFSTYTSVRAQGAIMSTRVIGVLAAGLLGGPYVDVGAAIIGGLHRYLFDIGGLTVVSYVVSTFVEGLIGSIFSRHFRAGKTDSTDVFLITTLAEVGQILVIILISKPFPAALELTRLIAFPIVIISALGMVVFIATFNTVFVEEDNQLAEKIRLALEIMEQSLSHLREGPYNAKDMEATTEVIYNSTTYVAVMITDTQGIPVVKGDARYNSLKGDAILESILDSIHNRKPITFFYAEKPDPLYHILKNHIIVAAPLIEMDKPIGNPAMVVRKCWHTSQSNLNFTSELARPFPTQLGLSDLDYQKQLRRKAEFRALQSQVNPYFLYNALNAVSYVCWKNPGRARELIRTLSSYYRQTLENDQYMLSLHIKLYHVSSYLRLEKTRFGEKLQVTMSVEEDTNCMVPSFILRPLVENTVRYGADGRGQRSVSIGTHGAGNSAEIIVTDEGPGFPIETVRQLYNNKGKGGMSLKNVRRRLKSIYGEDNSLKIELSQDGSKIWLRIPMQSELGQKPLYS